MQEGKDLPDNKYCFKLSAKDIPSLSETIPLKSLTGTTMSDRAFKVLVVGAGIAGLSASIALVEKGYHVTILEGAPKVKALLSTDLM